MTRLPQVAMALVILACAAGCGAFSGKKRVEPVLDAREKKVLVVPFRMGNRWHYHSREGDELGRSILLVLQRTCDGFQPVLAPAVEEAISTFSEEDVPWARFGRDAGAELVLLGSIEKLSLENPRAVGMLQSSAVVNMEIWDVGLGTKVFQRQILTRYPDDPASGEVFISFDQNARDVQRGLFARIAIGISELLCGYEEEDS
ncbi:MAG: hypothetical protein ACE5GW_01070 [Planctomycetota bacterium]